MAPLANHKPIAANEIFWLQACDKHKLGIQTQRKQSNSSYLLDNQPFDLLLLRWSEKFHLLAIALAFAGG